MTNLRKVCAVCTLFSVLSPGSLVFSQDRHDDQRDENRDARHDDNRDARHDDRRDDRSSDRANDRHDDHGYVRHDEWRKGYRMRHEDWDRGERIDYRQYRLRRPPEGYEWRQVDGNYVLAAVATGVIASVIVAAATHH